MIYDAIWESDRLAECSRDAALAYPWIFLVADDHGRFEYKPRAIWKNAFAYRQDVTVEDVARWLEEYWKARLLVRYHIDGELAHWHKFRGRKPSDRRPSEYPDPAGMPVFTQNTATTPPRRGDDTATSPRQTRARDRSDQDLDQSRTESAPATAVAPLVPPWSREACSDWNDAFGAGSAVGGKIGKALKPLVDHHGWPAVRVVWQRYLGSSEDDAKFKSPAAFAEKFAYWAAPARASPPGRKSLDDRAMDSAREAIELHRARGGK